MGNCCGGVTDEPSTSTYTTSGKKNTSAFQGPGHRLGSADENRTSQQNPQSDTFPIDPGGVAKSSELPAPINDPHLTNDERERQRLTRLAAAEARAKLTKTKKPIKASKSSEPLRGPNSKPSMTWTVGS